MLRFRKVFGSGKVFLPVIHAVYEEQALRNARIALGNGGDGIFLIGHGVPHQRLTEIYEFVREALPGAWIGMNYLDLGSACIGLQPTSASGLWVDDGMINMRDPVPHRYAALQWRSIENERGQHSSEDFLYFGGVHFKGQDQNSDPAEMARIAYPYMDVVTTSGPGTGRACDPKKIELMKKAIGDDGVLGLASGCTPENVRDYPDADVFLVAPGISKDGSFTELNPGKVYNFSSACR